FNDDDRRDFLMFLKNLIHIENPEINLKFNTEIEKLTKGEIEMGNVESITELLQRESRREGREDALLLVALRLKQKGVDFSIIAESTGLSFAEIEELKSDENKAAD
ncbi:hypothetical protein, partial [Pedobacter sp.]|uniref:hypothetical protein n=1 Tax=Pedobacter sp. TaxID=1411316 RepID=UPI003D7FE7A6